MKINNLDKQYNSIANLFEKETSLKDNNHISKYDFYKTLEGSLKDKKVLDVGCGDGIDAEYYRFLGGEVVGIDSSEGLLEIAKKKYPNIEYVNCLAENLPFENSSFDSVYSKYALMTSKNIQPIFDEVYRVLKQGGEFIYLVTHPLRQFIERKENNGDYFKQKIVNCLILDGTVELQEPTHTMNEYLNKSFFERFELIDFRESWDPASEQINQNKYPGYFIIKARKK